MNKIVFTVKTKTDYAELIVRLTLNTKPYTEKEGFKPFDVTIEEHKVKRTNLQNDYYWANATDIMETLNKKGCTILKMGVECKWTRYDVDEVNKTQFGTDSTAKLSTKEFGDLMETVFAFWIAKLKGEWQPQESDEKKAFNNYYGVEK